MQHFGLIFDNAMEAEAALEQLWDKLGLRGELQLLPMVGEGHALYKIDVLTEQDLTPSQLEKLPGKRA